MSRAKEFLDKGVAGKAALWQQKADNPEPFQRKKRIALVGPSSTSTPDADPTDSTSDPGFLPPGAQPGGSLEWDGTCYRQKIGKHGDDYGKPPPGSRTELRGRRAGMLISTEVIEVCLHIMRIGYRCPDGTYIVNFGTLFEMYTKISNKLVGMLLRARRQGLVQFDGEMLFQGRDENVIIRAIKVPKALEEFYIEMDGPVPDHMKMEQ